MNMHNSAGLTENVDTCPCCGNGPRSVLVAGARDLLTVSSPPGSFGIWRCLTCSSAYLSPSPTKEHLGLYYPEDEYLPMGQMEQKSNGGRLVRAGG